MVKRVVLMSSGMTVTHEPGKVCLPAVTCPSPDHTCSHLLYVALMTGNSVDQLVNATVAAQNLFMNEKYFCEGI